MLFPPMAAQNTPKIGRETVMKGESCESHPPQLDPTQFLFLCNFYLVIFITLAPRQLSRNLILKKVQNPTEVGKQPVKESKVEHGGSLLGQL